MVRTVHGLGVFIRTDRFKPALPTNLVKPKYLIGLDLSVGSQGKPFTPDLTSLTLLFFFSSLLFHSLPSTSISSHFKLRFPCRR
ncbi:hypothetical protein MANES_16G060450v8 [Manihot esculenta]|uniref:Uncharacterized protein n=3 Tax=Manihot esculenta TaxID=3983 RepID=A0ACB7G704_MANES|nr:hypothetical protein MANES_16G060450v8 [Manihot esculenta]KAG8635692.1 hypothetical protein MANES_16G060450v8 [Manihot esculenta]KAG8635693.1 hypothetical protein MANES_16G060450v8 [Manihot esculenta]